MRVVSSILFACVIVAFPAWLSAASKEAEIVSFEKHVRPILKAHCLECHGEGEETEGELDLRLRRFILKGGDSGAGFVVGKPEESPLYERTLEQEMPPGDTKLTKAELATIKKWIESGAQTLRPEPETIGKGVYLTEGERTFWSFQPIKNPKVPTVKHAKRVRTPVDAFLLRKLEEKNLTFSPDADRRTLIRRASFDLLGLPPSPKEVAQFVNDKDPKAYEKLIDRLLASPHYGERWGRHWLDVVGYADSEGFTIQDPVRKYSYRYRDYVIKAFNKDKPFDEFIREQLAGDEMLIQPYKDLTPDQLDKLVATGYLRMVADGTASSGVDAGIAQNQVMADTLQVVGSSLLGLTISCAQCHNHRYDPIPQTDYYHLRAIFEPAYDWKHWKKPSQRVVHLLSDEDKKKTAVIETEAKKVDAKRSAKAKILIEEALVDQLEQHVPKELHKSLRDAYYAAAKKRTKEQTALLKKYPVIMKISQGSLYLYDREIRIKRAALNSEYAKKTKQYISETREAELKKIPAESRAAAKAAAIQVAAKRNEAQKKILAQFPNVDVTLENLDKYNVKAATELKQIKAKIGKLVERAPQLAKLADEAKAIRAKKPKPVLVRALFETPGVVPDTFFFSRGNHTSPEQKLEPAVLTIASLQQKYQIPINDEKIPTTGRRLAYARYLTSGKHPLVARVLVNRFWMHHFGRGIVGTTGDFGLLGDRPTHPELLDWLASNFMNNGWSLKKLHRVMMTSTAYRQQLRTIPTQNDIDPDNKLLSGMSLRRLEAEVLRDSILKISNYLNTKQFGEAIPVMDDKVGQIVIGKENLSAGRPGAVIDMKGEQYRRSIYVQVRRSKPLAMLDMFDAPRMSPNCESRPSSTVAPQSLLLMNNDFVVQQSLAFALRVKKEAGDDMKAQVAFAWEEAFAQKPTTQEVASAIQFLNDQTKILSKQPAAQAKIKKDKKLSAPLLALASFCQALISSNQFLYVD